MASRISKAAVVGGGTMGAGIAHVMALAGIEVALIEARRDLADKALAGIAGNMGRQAAKRSITEGQKAEALARIKPATDMKAAASADLAVEAVNENADLKKKIFAELDRACPKGAILATNTSSISIGSIASATKRPGKVIGMHFMNPVPIMPLVEIIRGSATSDETYGTVRDLTLKLGKTPVCSKDAPGFISNRILMPMINEAVWALHEGVGTKEDIDTVMKLGMNHPMGPIALADFIGLDVCLSIMQVLYDGFKNPKYRPCPLLEQMVRSGRLGKKSGRGFYEY